MSPTPTTKNRSKAFPTRLGAAASAVVAVISIGSILFVAWRALPFRTASSLPAQPQPPTPLAASETRTALERVGIHPMALAAAGLNTADTTAVVTNARQYLSDHLTGFRATLIAREQAAFAVTTAESPVRERRASQEQLDQFEAARTALASALAAEQAALDALRTAALASLTQEQRAAIISIQDNMKTEVPFAYRAASPGRSEAQWVSLRDALSERRTLQSRQQEVPQDIAAVISSAEADPLTSSAIANLNVNSPSITQAFTQALGAE